MGSLRVARTRQRAALYFRCGRPGPPAATTVGVVLEGLASETRTCFNPGVEERSRRIIDTAVELAEQGGFEAVRLRDVADQAGVALGTLYRRFRSKEDLLVAALEQEAEDLERRVEARPPRGDTGAERVTSFFAAGTRGLCRRPNLTRAVLRAMTSGDPEIAGKVSRFHDRMTNLITRASPLSITPVTPGIVTEVSATLVARMIFRCLDSPSTASWRSGGKSP